MKSSGRYSRCKRASRSIDRGRRKALAGVVAGAGLASHALPQQWSRPLVESVLLPAHAQTSGSEPTYLFTCSVEGISEHFASPGDLLVEFVYTPIDSSGALNGQQVDTVYTARDADDNIIYGPLTVSHSSFNEPRQPIFSVAAPLPPGPYTVTVEFDDQATYGTASCSSSEDLPF